MGVICQLAAALAGLLHIGIFYLESVVFSRPRVYRRFLVADERDAAAVAPWAFNQGFYNLFLALGTLTGVLVWILGKPHQGRALIGFGCSCMLAAALVLVGTDRRMARAALTQGLLPLIALATIW
jgi:putative membrane protein